MSYLPGESFFLIALAVSITVLTPRVLARDRFIVRRPHLAITLWVTTLVVAALSLLAGTGIIIREAIHRTENATHTDWVPTVVDSLFAWASLAVLGILAFRIVDSAQNLWSERRHTIEELAPLLRRADVSEVGSTRVFLTESDVTILAAIPYVNGILVTTSARSQLSVDEFDAALAHERAHLRGRHSILVFASQLAMTAAGGFRASQRFVQTIRIAIELVADDSAVRQCGSNALAAALDKLFPDSQAVASRVRRIRLHSRGK